MLTPRCNLGVKLPEVSLAWDGNLLSIVGKYPPYERLAFGASMGRLLYALHSAGTESSRDQHNQPPSKEEHSENRTA